MVNKSKIEVLRGFVTRDTFGGIAASKGDIIEVWDYTAKMLIRQKLAKKYRPHKMKKQEG